MFSNHRAFASKLPLEGRAQIYKLDAGLTSIRGAQEIIALISSKRTVTKLVLGHNDLGNEGTNVLFRFLESSLGKHYPITEISLNSNGIRDEGLLAISRYLKGNRQLKELFLQANAFTGDPTVTKAFVDALNSSSLEVLSLATNPGLGDGFIQDFMPALNAPLLRELRISTIGLTPRSVPFIAEFLRSPERCHLHTLACNGNSLGLRGVRHIIRAIEQRNYSLLSTEFYANQLSGDPMPTSFEDELEDAEEENLDESSDQLWKDCQTKLTSLRHRNAHLKRETEKQALDLLKISRVVLLRSSRGTHNQPPASPTSRDKTGSIGSPFAALPIELKLSILSLLAPSLSAAQRNRIFTYAASAQTLPALLPSLTRRTDCIPDTSQAPLLSPTRIWPIHTSLENPGCSNGQCIGVMNAVSCSKEKDRTRWLEAMGCSRYEPE